MLDGQSAPIWYFEDGIVEFIVKPFSEARIIGRTEARTVTRGANLKLNGIATGKASCHHNIQK